MLHSPECAKIQGNLAQPAVPVLGGTGFASGANLIVALKAQLTMTNVHKHNLVRRCLQVSLRTLLLLTTLLAVWLAMFAN